MGTIRVALILLGLVTLSAAQFDYSDAIRRSLLFYEAQRSGILPLTNRIPYRGHSFVTDQGLNGHSLIGGYFDSGNHIKFGFPFASTLTNLAWGLVDAREGYENAGQLGYARDALRWGIDYLIRAHPEPNVLYVQVANATEDHAYWGRPEQWTGSNPRPFLRATTALPASEVAAESAAALAASSMVYRQDGHHLFANKLLKHAKELYTFGTTYRQKYSDSFPEVSESYNSWSGYGDEFFWAAAWLFRATNDVQYQQDYNQFWTEFGLSVQPVELSWDDKTASAQILLARIDGSPQYVTAATNFCNWVVNTAPRTPLGLVFISPWGSLRHASNVAWGVAQCANAGINPVPFRAFVKQQIDYILGSTGRSYVVGLPPNPPQRPHHRSSSCPDMPAPCDWSHFDSPGPNPQILHGALVGGPDQNDNWADNRDDFVTNEVTIDYNALFQSVLADMVQQGL